MRITTVFLAVLVSFLGLSEAKARSPLVIGATGIEQLVISELPNLRARTDWFDILETLLQISDHVVTAIHRPTPNNAPLRTESALVDVSTRDAMTIFPSALKTADVTFQLRYGWLVFGGFEAVHGHLFDGVFEPKLDTPLAQLINPYLPKSTPQSAAEVLADHQGALRGAVQAVAKKLGVNRDGLLRKENVGYFRTLVKGTEIEGMPVVSIKINEVKDDFGRNFAVPFFLYTGFEHHETWFNQIFSAVYTKNFVNTRRVELTKPEEIYGRQLGPALIAVTTFKQDQPIEARYRDKTFLFTADGQPMTKGWNVPHEVADVLPEAKQQIEDIFTGKILLGSDISPITRTHMGVGVVAEHVLPLVRMAQNAPALVLSINRMGRVPFYADVNPLWYGPDRDADIHPGIHVWKSHVTAH